MMTLGLLASSAAAENITQVNVAVRNFKVSNCPDDLNFAVPAGCGYTV
ncbi:MAG: hypothetical protein Q4C54_09065 [Clostridia bacterium]|nr:hypothetical protein [Clostridia bacterium]